MNKRQRKKHGATKPPGRRRLRRRWADCTVTDSCGNVFRDLGLPDPDRMLEDAERTFVRDPKSRRVDRIRDSESQD